MGSTVGELVFIPAPVVGHIMSAIEMAKVLVNRDQRLSISVILISPPYPISALTTYIQSLTENTIQRIRFIKLPLNPAPPKPDPKAPVTSFYQFIDSHGKYITNVVTDIINQTRLVGFVVDILCVGMIDVANEFNVPTYVFFAANSAFLGTNLYIERLYANQSQYVTELSNSEGEIVVPYFVNPVPMKRTMGVGKVIGWAPQVALLAHEAVGGFVSHCGWNSLLESLWFGVPTAAWPLYAEQQMNAFEMVVELGLAVDLKLDYKIDLFNPGARIVIVTAEEIESGIRRLMEDNKVRAKVKDMSKMCRETVVEGGSSYASVGYLIEEITSKII
ncbi:hypothetical protein E3N88_26768 [Mikania micrantha]|uniref:Uncharacterized protein n=1 Tax=Mikania micrantha TaxID=192012 RepID=A0A5N6MVR8_9ASTR|nr:hypothetical protein E3N88_26768 [Mikania micrantha]